MDEMLDVLKKVAPTIAGMICSPLAGIATDALIKAFDGDEEKAKAVMAGSELSKDDLIKIKQADKALELKYARLSQSDRADARKMAVDGGVTNKLFWLSAGILGAAVGGYLGILFFGYAAGLDDMVVGRGMGFLEMLAGSVIGFWLGTSFGSQQKTEIMAKK